MLGWAAPHLRRRVVHALLTWQRAVIAPGHVLKPPRESAAGKVVHHPRHAGRLRSGRPKRAQITDHLITPFVRKGSIAHEHLDSCEDTITGRVQFSEALFSWKVGTCSALVLDDPLVLVFTVVLKADKFAIPFVMSDELEVTSTDRHVHDAGQVLEPGGGVCGVLTLWRDVVQLRGEERTRVDR